MLLGRRRSCPDGKATRAKLDVSRGINTAAVDPAALAYLGKLPTMDPKLLIRAYELTLDSTDHQCEAGRTACLTSGCRGADWRNDRGCAAVCTGVTYHSPNEVLTIIATLQFFVHGNQCVTIPREKTPPDTGYILKWVVLNFLCAFDSTVLEP